MNTDKNVFNHYEKIFLRISLGLLGGGILLFGLMFLMVDYIKELSGLFSGIVLFLLLSSIASFFTSIFRILKYIFIVSKRNDESTITKSIISFFTSPIAIILYYIIIIIIAFSSCSIQ